MDPEGYPLPQSSSWIPSNLNLSAQGAMVEEARAEGCAWSPSYLNLNLSEECVCPPGQPMLESPQGREQEIRTPSIRIGSSVRTIGEGDFQQNKENYASILPPNEQPTCICTKSRGAGEDENKFPGYVTSKEMQPEEAPPPVAATAYASQERCSKACPGVCKGPDPTSAGDESRGRGGRGSRAGSSAGASAEHGQSTGDNEKLTDPLEDVYIWEARSYTGSADSEEMERMRIEGKVPIPLAPGERSEESIKEAINEDGAFDVKIKSLSPSRYSGDTTQTTKGGQEGPENETVALEDVYVWEARSYTGSADSDAQEEMRLAGKAPIPKGPGERSEEDMGGERAIADDSGRPPDDACFETCAGICKNVSRAKSDSAQQRTINPPSTEQTQTVDGVQRRPCGCRASSENISQPQIQIEREEGDKKLPQQKRPCPCLLEGSGGHSAQCVCKHCKKKREKESSQPQQDHQLNAQPSPCPSIQPVDEGKVLSVVPQQQTTELAGHAAAGGKVACLPCTIVQDDVGGEIKCFCKPTVHDRVEYLTNLLMEGISPLHEALEAIQMKMKAMGLLGKEPGAVSKSKGGAAALASRGAESGGTGSPGGAGSPGGPRKGAAGPTAAEPSFAIYIMSPGTSLPPNATKIHPQTPQQLNSASQMSTQHTAYDQKAEKNMQPNEVSCKCFQNTNPPLSGSEGQKYGQEQSGQSNGCCQLPCCPRRPQSAQLHSKP